MNKKDYRELGVNALVDRKRLQTLKNKIDAAVSIQFKIN